MADADKLVDNILDIVNKLRVVEKFTTFFIGKKNNK